MATKKSKRNSEPSKNFDFPICEKRPVFTFEPEYIIGDTLTFQVLLNGNKQIGTFSRPVDNEYTEASFEFHTLKSPKFPVNGHYYKLDSGYEVKHTSQKECLAILEQLHYLFIK